MFDRALTLDAELKIASELAIAAGKRIRKVRQEGALEGVTKPDASPVTRADIESDAVIREGLRAAFPNDGILSEEDRHVPSQSGRTWVVDPLDGTKSFLAGGSEYAVHIGLLRDGEPVVGVVYEPDNKRLYQGLAGVASFVSASIGTTVRQVRVSRRAVPEHMAMVTSSGLPTAAQQRLLRHTGLSDGGKARGVGYKVGLLVRREADVYYSAHPVHYWDTCAPYVVLTAAGGVMTALDGTPLSFDLTPPFRHPQAFVATNGTRHSELTASLSAALSEAHAGGPTA